jgi:4-hydroxybenzoate polyprenyltransferase/phosphoserine phosphatase
MQASCPLFVDLDGTLIKTDLLVESFIGLLKRHPLTALQAPFWLLRGKAHFKERIAQAVEIDPALLPYHQEFLSYLETQRKEGRAIYLATACNQRYAHAIAGHLAIFDGVVASDGDSNRSGQNKLSAIRKLCPNGFVYAGNGRVDLPIWESAERAILVNVPKALAVQVARNKPIEAQFMSEQSSLSALLKAIRPHQWLKNLLVFLPLLPIATSASSSMLAMAMLAFVAFSLCASSVYLLNDLSDLAADRAHPRKRDRPFASGALAPLNGLLLAPLLLASAFALTLLMPWKFAAALGLYWLSTMAYTFVLKRYALIDVTTLAGLYTLRVLGGAAAIAVAPSFWILAFSMFIFFSLALAKRYVELHAMRSLDKEGAKGRGYQVTDLQVVQLMGVAAGYMAVLVMALYINSPDIVSRYQHVKLLWGVCPLLMLWISRVWLKAARCEMADDPLVFAVRDRMSRYILALTVILILVALI